jgi:hypothetical protein
MGVKSIESEAAYPNVCGDGMFHFKWAGQYVVLGIASMHNEWIRCTGQPKLVTL